LVTGYGLDYVLFEEFQDHSVHGAELEEDFCEGLESLEAFKGRTINLEKLHEDLFPCYFDGV
jgi:hypothetical protein